MNRDCPPTPRDIKNINQQQERLEEGDIVIFFCFGSNFNCVQSNSGKWDWDRNWHHCWMFNWISIGDFFGRSEGCNYPEAIWRYLLVVVREDQNDLLIQQRLIDRNLIGVYSWKYIDMGWEGITMQGGLNIIIGGNFKWNIGQAHRRFWQGTLLDRGGCVEWI